MTGPEPLSIGGRGPDVTDWPVIGHEPIVRSLRQALAVDRVSHAYLMVGPSGTGKATLSRIFARALCCQSPARADMTVPCGICLACRKIERGVHPDVQLLDLATQATLGPKRTSAQTTLSIDSIRQLAADAALKPMEAPRRVIVVDDAETMQEVAQEALLKTLEEPPPSVLLMLLADDAGSLLPTIQSRCQVINLRPVAGGAIAAGLIRSGVDSALAAEIAVLAAGRPGWAIRAAHEPTLIAERRAAADRALSWIEASTYSRLVTAVKVGDAFAKRRSDVFTDLESLLTVWRDLMLLRASLPDLVTQRSAIDRLGALAHRWRLDAITRATRAVQRCQADLESNVRPRLALESMVLAWPAATDSA